MFGSFSCPSEFLPSFFILERWSVAENVLLFISLRLAATVRFFRYIWRVKNGFGMIFLHDALLNLTLFRILNLAVAVLRDSVRVFLVEFNASFEEQL